MKLFSTLSVITFLKVATASFDETVIFDSPIHSEFKYFSSKYNKYYPTSSEYAQRLRNFADNYEYINDLNEFYGGYARFEINSFADLDVEEFSNYYARGSSRGTAYTDTECEKFKSSGDEDYPDELDWRDYNAVTGVKNQGQCGSCWSFSSPGAMEGAWAIATDNLVNLSQQQLMDCSWSYGDFGCHGGMMDNAFKYAIENGMCVGTFLLKGDSFAIDKLEDYQKALIQIQNDKISMIIYIETANAMIKFKSFSCTKR